MMNVKRFLKNDLTKNAFLSGMSKPVSMILSFVYVPMTLDYLGIEKYGAWSAILSVLSWILYLDVGIGNGLRTKLADAFAKNDERRSRCLISSAYCMISMIVFSFMIIMIIIASFIEWNDLLGMKQKYDNLRKIIILSAVFMSVSFILSLCKSIFFALNKAAINGLIDIVSQISNIMLLYMFSGFTNGSLLVVSVLYGVSTLFSILLFTMILFSKHKELIPSLKEFNFQNGKEISSLGIKFFVIQISGLILFSTDNLLIANFFGAEDVTPYNIVNKIFTAIIGIHAAVLSPFWTGITQAKSKKDFSKAKNIVKINTALIIPFTLFAIIIGIFFETFTDIWLHRELVYGNLIWLGVMYCSLYIIGNTYGVLASGLSAMKVQVYSAVLQAAINIPLSLVFGICFHMKSAGIMMGTVVSMTIAAVSMPLVVFLEIRKFELKGNE